MIFASVSDGGISGTVRNGRREETEESDRDLAMLSSPLQTAVVACRTDSDLIGVLVRRSRHVPGDRGSP